MFISSLILTIIVTFTAAQIPDLELQVRLMKFFANLDTDKSGKVSFTEFQSHAKGVDADSNSQISLAEYIPNTPAGHKQIVPLFKYLDQNKNGYLDDSDIKAMFYQFDVNVDSEVSRQEFMVEYEALYMLIESEVVKPVAVG